MHQGWPKLAASLWMATPDGGLAAVAYAPCEVRARTGGLPVTVLTETDYPFRDSVTVTVVPERAARFPLLFRVPRWTEGATLQVEREPAGSLTPGTFHRLDREWNGLTTLTLRFPMRPLVTRRYHGALPVERGPLVYSLLLEEAWTRVNADKPHRELPHGDFEVRPASPWNYGLLLDPDTADPGIAFAESPVGEQPFSPAGAGMRATIEARRLPNWKLEHGWIKAATFDKAPPQIRDLVKEHWRPEYDQIGPDKKYKMAPQLDFKELTYAMDRWDREIGAQQIKRQ